ncbi:MAG: lipoyl synthase [Elusimicrobia bacterium]|nr:lipoyl synthase [Candidatus Obscuribacterium magneticum]
MPAYLKQRIPSGETFIGVNAAIRENRLNTVCQEAKCPNRSHCFSRGTLAIQILGQICTRACGFCGEKFGTPHPPDPTEPERVVQAATRLNLKHVVITSPARDDLSDDGAGHFASVVTCLKEKRPQTTVEILTPDFRGRSDCLNVVFESRPHIFNHNIETVRRLTPRVRSRASYDRTLFVLRASREFGLMTKSGLMVGHGETVDELRETLKDLSEAGCQLLTIGQYLPPSSRHLPLVKLYAPHEFDILREEALQCGFLDVSAGPLVRSSYHAEELVIANEVKQSVVTRKISGNHLDEQQIASLRSQ